MLPELFKDLIALPLVALRSRRSCTDDPQERLKTRTAKIPDALSPKRKELSISYSSAANASSRLLTLFNVYVSRYIYTYALGSHLVHILLNPSRIAHFCCTCPTPTDFNRACCPSARHLIVPKSVPIPPPPQCHCPPAHLPSYLCRSHPYPLLLKHVRHRRFQRLRSPRRKRPLKRLVRDQVPPSELERRLPSSSVRGDRICHQGPVRRRHVPAFLGRGREPDARAEGIAHGDSGYVVGEDTGGGGSMGAAGEACERAGRV